MDTTAIHFLGFEARALSGRLGQVQPFALTEVMVPAAGISGRALWAIERHMEANRKALHERIRSFVSWLESPFGQRASASDGQRRFVLLRLHFNRVLTQFDLFADALSQRSERENGVWLAGLDAIALDALAMPGFYDDPPVICYLDRGAGAAIRRARTRLPGGGSNPVAIIRVPRERMVGYGIASSLVHEVGHQAAALLDLVNFLRPQLALRARHARGGSAQAWQLFERWISEIVADFWSVARLGVVSTMGLFGVVSLPRAFVFRMGPDDPHPFPWIRVLLSCAIGRALYPDPQWHRLEALWKRFYPPGGLGSERRGLLDALEAQLPEFVDRLLNARPPSLAGLSLVEAMQTEHRHPADLRNRYHGRRGNGAGLFSLPPTLALAVLGQQRADNAISAVNESRILGRLLTHWALQGALATSARPDPIRRVNHARHIQLQVT